MTSWIPNRRSEVRQVFNLALPMIVMNLTNMGIGVVDTIMAGRYSGIDMAAVALGSSVFFPALLFSHGVLSIIGPIVAHLRGRNMSSRIGDVVNHGLWLALALSVFVIGVLLVCLPWIPEVVNQEDARMAEVAMRYVYWLMLGIPANLIFILFRTLNEGVNMTRPAMFVGIVALLINIPLNWIFVEGHLGMPRMGGVGCGVASMCVFWIQLLLMFAMVYHHPKHREYRKQMISLRIPRMSQLASILKLGVPLGFSILCEVLLFCVASVVLSPLGYVSVGSHQVAANVSGLCFMVPLSIALAASIRVAYHVGRRDVAGTRDTIRAAYKMVLTFAVVTCALILCCNTTIVKLYNDEPEIVRLAASLLVFAAFFQFSDMLQAVSSGILRGFKDTVILSVVMFIAYWVIGFPVGYVLSRTDWVVAPMGAKGMWIGFIVGLTSSAVMLLFRVRSVKNREFLKIVAARPDTA